MVVPSRLIIGGSHRQIWCYISGGFSSNKISLESSFWAFPHVQKMFISNFMTLAIETVSSTLLASFPLNFLVEQDDIKLWLERLTQHRGLVQSDVEPCEMMQLLDKIESSKVTRFNSGGDAESCQMMLSHVRWCWVVKGAIMSDVAESQMLSHVT